MTNYIIPSGKLEVKDIEITIFYDQHIDIIDKVCEDVPAEPVVITNLEGCGICGCRCGNGC